MTSEVAEPRWPTAMVRRLTYGEGEPAERPVPFIPSSEVHPLGGDFATVDGEERELYIGGGWNEASALTDGTDALIEFPVWSDTSYGMPGGSRLPAARVGTRYRQARWVPAGSYQAAVAGQELRRNPPPRPILPVRVPLHAGRPATATTADLMAALRMAGAHLEAIGGRLLISGRGGHLAGGLLEAAARYEVLIVADVMGEPVSCWLCPEHDAQPAVTLGVPAVPICSDHAAQPRG